MKWKLIVGLVALAAVSFSTLAQARACTPEEREADRLWATPRCVGVPSRGIRPAAPAAEAVEQATVDPTWRPQSAAVREWLSAQQDVAGRIETAIKRNDRGRMSALHMQALTLIGEAPVELGEHGRVHCAMATQSLANMVLSAREGKVTSTAADRREWQRYQADCRRSASR